MRSNLNALVQFGLACLGLLCQPAWSQAMPNPVPIGIKSPAPAPLVAPAALPTGAQVVQGQATLSQAGNALTVQQASDRLVTNWDSFNIGESALVRFVQPSSSAVALNRVLSNDATQILGGLEANGQVFIVNPAGVLFGRSARVDVGGLVASSLAIADADFMAGRTVFAGSGGGSVENLGQVQAGAYVAFIAPRVKNGGALLVPQGDVVLAAGEQVSLDFAGDRLLRFSVDKGTVDALVANQGLVQAAGGRVVLSARAADAVARAVVHQGGIIDASSLSARGGRVVLEGDEVTLAAGSTTRADGATGGGSVLVGGAWQGQGDIRQAQRVTMDADARVSADATRQGAGGEVVLWSDVHAEGGLTTAAGTLSARGVSQGGRIETSGHAVSTDGARVDAGASQGPGGLWLIDPYNYTIDAPQAAAIVGTLNTGTSVTVDTTLDNAGQGSTGSGVGDITVSSAIAKTAGGDATLTLKAHNDIAVNAGLTSTTGKLGVVLWADQDNSGAGSIQVNSAAITSNGGQIVMGGGLDANADGRPDGAAVGSSRGVYLNNATVNSGSGTLKITGAHGVKGIEMNASTLGGSGQSGAITLTADSLAFSGTNTLQTTGEAVIEPIATSFTSALNLGLAVTGASGLRVGKEGNTADVTLTSAASVAGPISIYGGHVVLNANLTSTATGDLFIKSTAADNTSLAVNANILKTGGARSTLTLQSGGRIGYGGTTEATGTALDVVVWSDYGNANAAGATHWGTIKTNGGHLWMGGSSTSGGSLKWNGLTVGDGPSIGKTGVNANAIDVIGTTDTAGGDILLWASVVSGSGTGINGNSAVLTAGSGNVTLLADSMTLRVSTTGHLTLAPDGGSYGGTLTWSGAMSGADLALTGTYSGLVIKNMATLGGLTLGQYSGLLHPVMLTPVVMGNSSDVTVASATDVAGTIGIYGNRVILNANLTSTATGDIFIKSQATGSDSLVVNADILKTGGNRSVLTLQSGGRIRLESGKKILASGTPLDVVLWSDYGNANTGGTSLFGNITTNGGHLWAGGSNSSGGSLAWNGLTVGDGPSIGANGANLNALDVTGQVNTGGGDILLWSGAGYAGGGSLTGNSGLPLTAGSGNVTLLTNWVASLHVNTTGILTLAPYNGSYGSTLTWSGSLSGTDLAPTGIYSGLTIKNYASLGGLTLGEYRGMQQAGTPTPTPLVLGNANDLTWALTTGTAGAISLHGNSVNLNTNLTSTGAGAVTITAANRVVQGSGVTVSSQGGAISYQADSDANGTGSISVGQGATLTSHGGAITLDAATSQAGMGIDLNGATVNAGTGALTLTGAGTSQAVRVGAGSTVTAAAITVEGDGEVRLDSGLTVTNGLLRIEADRFVNTAGSGALSAVGANSHWEVFSRNADPFNATTGDVRNGLVYDYKQYNYADGDTVLGTGNGFLYSYAPIVDVSATGTVTRAYDGTVAAALGAGNYSYTGVGAVDGDSGFSFSSMAAYTTAGTGVGIKDVGAGKTVTVSSMAVAGASKGLAQVYGYRVNPLVSTLAGAITPRAITAITGITAASKIYDGTTAATLTTTGAGFTGLVSGETLTVATATGAFSDKNAALGKTVAISGLSLGGADAGNYLLTDTTASTTADITPKALAAITGITANHKVYDGGLVAALTTTGASFSGMVSGDVLTVGSGTGAFADKNVGAGKSVAISGLTLGGADAGNYTLTSTTATATADITPKAIAAITGITAADKVYDGTTAATLTTLGAGFTGMVAGDALSVASSTGAFGDKHAGSGKTVAISGLSLGGADAGNYTLTDTTASTTATITPKAIAAITGITAEDKTYDGGTAATLDTSGASFTGMVSGDALTVASSTGAFGDKNVGTGKFVAISGLTLGGADAGNYTLATPTAGTSATITPKAITAITGITASDKVYDGSVTALLATLGAGFTGMVSGDALSVASSTATFADKHVGAGKTVAISGLTLGGADAGNYTLTGSTASTTASITPKAIAAITGITAHDKVYDGSTAATLATAGAGFTGMVAGDALSVASGSGTFADKHVGSGKAVAISGLALGGADAGNYTLTGTTASATATITPRTIAVITGITASNKVYDGGTAATLNASGAGFTGMVSGDALTVASSSGAFGDKNVGTGKFVAISGLSLGGADAGNYLLASTSAATSADITPLAISAITGITGITAANKVYDGHTMALLDTSGAGFTGMVSGDVLSVATSTGTFADKNVGTGKFVAITGLSLGGADAGNYTLTGTTASTTADITPKALTAITGITAASKVYDGGTGATLTTTGAGFTGMVAGDALTVASGTGVFSDKHAAVGKTVAISGLSLGGADAGNYTLTSTTASTTAAITPKAITAITGLTASDKVYDGSTAAALATSGAGFTGIVSGDALNVATGTGAFADRHAGTAKTVAITGLVLGGADAGNYTLTDTTATTTAHITPKWLTATASAPDKAYDGTLAAAPVLVLQGLVGGDTLGSAATGTFNSKDVLTAHTVTVTGIALQDGSGLAGDYRITAGQTASAHITPRELTLAVPGAGKVYDGTTAIQISGATTLGGVLGSDDVQLGLGQVTGFADKHAGQHKAVIYTGFALSGTDVANYMLPAQALSDAEITPRPLVLVVTAQDKTYDGQTRASVLTQDDRLTGDAFTVALQADFADKNVGVDKAVGITGITLSGPDAGNYAVATSAQSQATIVRLNAVQWVGGGATGDWFDPANWAGGAVPDLANVAVVHLPAGADVQFDGAAHAPVQLDALQGAQGQMTLGSGALNVGGDMQLHQLTQTGGALDVGGTLSLHAGLFNGGTLHVGGDADVDALTLGGTAQAQVVGQLTAPQVTQQGGSLSVGGDALIDALTQTGGTLDVGNALTVAQAYAQSGSGQVAVGGSAHITTLDSAPTLGNLSSHGPLTVVSHGGAITQAADTQLLVQGPARFTATTATGTPADIVLAQTGNRFSAPVSVNGRSATVHGQGGLTLGELALAGNLAVQTDGALNLGQGRVNGTVRGESRQGITQTGGLQVAGGIHLNGGQGAIVLDHPDNDWSGPVVLTTQGQVTASSGQLAAKAMQQAPVAPQRLPSRALAPAAVGQGAEMTPIVVVRQEPMPASAGTPIRFEVRLGDLPLACEARLEDGVLTIHLPAGVTLTAESRQRVVAAALAAVRQDGATPPGGIALVTVALGGPVP